MYKQDLGLNNLQGLICHKTLPTISFFHICIFTYHQIYRIYTPIFLNGRDATCSQNKDVSKLISLGNLLVRKVTWFVLTTTSATLILSRDFGSN